MIFGKIPDFSSAGREGRPYDAARKSNPKSNLWQSTTKTKLERKLKMQVLKSIFFAVATLALITIALAQLISPRTIGQAAKANVTASGTIKTQDVDNPARHAFQFAFGPTVDHFVVPADQRLTIETASASCQVDPPAPAFPNFQTNIETNVAGSIVIHQLLTYFQATGTGSVTGIQFYVGNATAVRIYADPGTTVSAFTGRSGSHCGVSISGYMIPQ
jgi:hypothetical protein